MPQPRTATALLEARGAFKNHPNRKREDPKVSTPFVAVAPAELDPLEVKWWHKLVKMVPDGVLTGADQATVILAATLMAEFMSDRRGFPSAKIAQMRAVFGELGLSPSARAKLATKPEADDGDF